MGAGPRAAASPEQRDSRGCAGRRGWCRFRPALLEGLTDAANAVPSGPGEARSSLLLRRRARCAWVGVGHCRGALPPVARVLARGDAEPIEGGGLVGHSLRRPCGRRRRGHDYRAPPRRLRGIGGCACGKCRNREARSSEQQRKSFHAASFSWWDQDVSPSPVPRRRPPLPRRPYSRHLRSVKRRAYRQRAASPRSRSITLGGAAASEWPLAP
jgi:hypothetical protein